MKLPEALLESLSGVAGFERESFVQVHQEARPPTSVRINLAKAAVSNEPTVASHQSSAICHQSSAMGNEQSTMGAGNIAFLAGADSRLPIAASVPWCATGFYLTHRPSFTFDPLFHAGCYYVQEASSMFLEQPFRQLLNLSQPVKVLDLCAAPGGKSTHIQSLLSPESLLVSNEVIRPRSVVLTDNIIRWGRGNVIVTNNDPKAFGRLPAYFDVMVVDAPCSGSGLFRKDAEAIEEWSPQNVALCSQRQQRILADALPALKEEGLLIYSTCSYSVEEDETIADWLVEEMGMESLSLNTEAFDGIVQTASPKTSAGGYRFYPDKVNGEGFFLACFRKRRSEAVTKLRPAKTEAVAAKDKTVLREWLRDEALAFLRFRESIFALSEDILSDFSVLLPVLNLHYAGVRVGEIMKGRLVPDHALAQSLIVKKDLPALNLRYDEAIKYLQRQDVSLPSENIGWHVVRHNGHNLGWANVLKNRVNNYYPKELRILKQRNDSGFEN